MERGLPDSFDAIIVGTGLLESVLAGAFARAGKSVLHLDRSTNYGSHYSSFTINDLLAFLEEQSKSLPLTSAPLDTSNNIEVKSYSAFLTNILIESSDTKEKIFPRTEQRKYSIDLFPCLLWSQGSFIDLLIRSGVSRYLEFKCMEQLLMPVGGVLQQVPCSKADVFQSKNISLKEKRQLMKFLQSVALPSAEDTAEFEKLSDTPFVAFLTSKGITTNLIEFITYAISLIDADQNSSDNQVSLKGGLEKMKTFMSSLGRYGNTPFLTSLYGTSEITQAFCRLAAVFGATYVLDRSVSKVIFEEGQYKGVVDTTGQKISSPLIISNTDHLHPLTTQHTKNISRAICITDKSISTDTDLVIVRVPPSAEMNIKNAITILQLNSSTNNCPAGKFLVHFTTPSTATAQQDLELVVRSFFNHKDDTEKAENKPNLLWNCYFNMTSRVPQPGLPQNVIICPDPEEAFGCEDVLSKAEELFKKVYPNEVFISPVPHPEDIIYEPADGTVDLENPAPPPQQEEEQQEPSL